MSSAGVIGTWKAEFERDLDRVALQSERGNGLRLGEGLAEIGICIRTKPFAKGRRVVEGSHVPHSNAAGLERAVWHNSGNENQTPACGVDTVRIGDIEGAQLRPMSVFANYRADRLIAEIKTTGNPNSPQAQKAFQKLLAARAERHRAYHRCAEQRREARDHSLRRDPCQADRRPNAAAGFPGPWPSANGRATSGIAWALSSSRGYPAAALLDALNKEGMPKPAILDVITAQKSRYSVRDLLNAAYAQEPTERAALFKIIGEIADESSIDDLVARIEGKDPVARLHIIQVLGRFNTPTVQQAVQKQLKDNNKLVRSAALSALARMDGPFDMPLVTGMLRDAEIEVQNKAVDVVIKANASGHHRAPGGSAQGRE